MEQMDNKNTQFPIQGLINLESGTYLFRGDTFSDHKYWAWKIEHDNLTDRYQCHKWSKLPRSKRKSMKGDVILFNLDDPPPTVPYMPILE